MLTASHFQMQRVQQMHVDVDLVPKIDPEADLQPLIDGAELEPGSFIKPSQVGNATSTLTPS